MAEQELDVILKSHLQKHISISIDGVEVKSGKFILYQNNILSNNFYYDLTIERVKKIDSFKIPFPFSIDHYIDEGLVYLDYRLASLISNKKHLVGVTNLYSKLSDPLKVSKFMDKIVEIEFK